MCMRFFSGWGENYSLKKKNRHKITSFFFFFSFFKYPGWKVILRRLVVITVFIYLLYKVDRQTNFLFSFSFFKQRKCFSIVDFSTHRTDIPHTAEWRATTEARGTHRLIKFYIWKIARTQRTLPGEHVGSHCPMLRMTTLSSVRHDGLSASFCSVGGNTPPTASAETSALPLHWRFPIGLKLAIYVLISIFFLSPFFFFGGGGGVKI